MPAKRSDREINTQDKNEAWKNQHAPETLLIFLFIQLVSSKSELASLSAKAKMEIYPGKLIQ